MLKIRLFAALVVTTGLLLGQAISTPALAQDSNNKTKDQKTSYSEKTLTKPKPASIKIPQNSLPSFYLCDGQQIDSSHVLTITHKPDGSTTIRHKPGFQNSNNHSPVTHCQIFSKAFG